MLTQLSLEELFRHIIIFGTTGCGKKFNLLLPLLHSLLARDAEDSGKRAGALTLDMKGDLVEPMKAVMAAAGRTEDLRVISQGGDSCVNPFIGQLKDSLDVAKRIIELANSLHPLEQGSSNEDFGHEDVLRLLQVAVVLTRARHLGEMAGVGNISDALNLIACVHDDVTKLDNLDEETVGESDLLLETRTSVELANGYGAVSDSEAKLALNYLDFDSDGLKAPIRDAIMNHARSFMTCLASSKLGHLFTPSPGWAFSPDEILDHGRVVVVSVSPNHYGPGAATIYSLIKTAFQTSALQRRNRIYFDGRKIRPINCIRPVYFVANELPLAVVSCNGNGRDSHFLEKCGESLVSCLLTAQSVNVLSVCGSSPDQVHRVLNKFGTKVFIGCECAETQAYFEALFRPELQNEVFCPDLRQLKSSEAIVVETSGEAQKGAFEPFLGAGSTHAGENMSLTNGRFRNEPSEP